MYIFALLFTLSSITYIYWGCGRKENKSFHITIGVMLGSFGGFLLFLLSREMMVPNVVLTVMILVGYILFLVYYRISAPKRELERANRKAKQRAEQLSRQKKMREDRQSEFGGTTLDRFFVECVLDKCNNFSQEKDVERAKMFAYKYGLEYPDGIQALYESGLEAHKAVSAKLDSARVAKLRIEEKKEYDRLYRYLSFYGKGKKIAMLNDQLNELKEKVSLLDFNNLSNSLIRSSQQKEGDWATWGGIANGLAGPAAGLATAMDIQARNAQIRAQNEANMRELAPLNLAIVQSALREKGKLNNQINTIVQEIQQVKGKLISDTPPEKVFEMLQLNAIKSIFDVSETGAFKITTTAKTTVDLHLPDGTPAVADGFLVAHVFEDGKELGTVNMVCPVDGIQTNRVAWLEGVGLFGVDKNKEQTVTFTAGNLWLMEK